MTVKQLKLALILFVLAVAQIVHAQTPVIIAGTDTNETIEATDIFVAFETGMTNPKEVNLTRLRTLMQQGISSGLNQAAVDARVVAGITGKLDIDVQNVDVNLNTAEKTLFRNAIGASDAIEIFRGTYSNAVTYRRGDIVQQNFRFWIAITTSGTNHANNTSPAAENHNAWRPIDGQFRTHTPGNTAQSYLRGDHLFVSENLWFCRVDGSYTMAQILAGPSQSPPTWEQLSGESGGGGGGTLVGANPDGTDGDDLSRISIDGTNFNIAGSGVGSVTQVGTLTNSFNSASRSITLDSGWDDYFALLWVYRSENNFVSSAVMYTHEIDQWASGASLAFPLNQNDLITVTTVSGDTITFSTIGSPFVANTVLTVYGLNYGGLQGLPGQAGQTGQDGADGTVVTFNPAGGGTLTSIVSGGNTWTPPAGGGGGGVASVTQIGTLTNSFHSTARAITLDAGWDDYFALLWVYRKNDHSIYASARTFLHEIDQWASGRTLRFGIEQNDRLDITSVAGNVIGFLTVNSAFAASNDVLTVYGLNYGGLRGVQGLPGQDGARRARRARWRGRG